MYFVSLHFVFTLFGVSCRDNFVVLCFTFFVQFLCLKAMGNSCLLVECLSWRRSPMRQVSIRKWGKIPNLLPVSAMHRPVKLVLSFLSFPLNFRNAFCKAFRKQLWLVVWSCPRCLAESSHLNQLCAGASHLQSACAAAEELRSLLVEAQIQQPRVAWLQFCGDELW